MKTKLEQLIIFLLALTILWFAGLFIVQAWQFTIKDYQRIGMVLDEDRERNGIEGLEGR
jgi:hypothetical protein